jgi:hypothetical protein
MSDLPPPHAPTFKSDEEINRITLDPVLPCYGQSNALFSQVTTPAPVRVALGGYRPDHSIRRIEIRKER